MCSQVGSKYLDQFFVLNASFKVQTIDHGNQKLYGECADQLIDILQIKGGDVLPKVKK